MTQGEKITKISTQVEFIVETIKKIDEKQSLFATKAELNEKAGVWTEGWIKVIAFATAGAIIVQIIVNAL